MPQIQRETKCATVQRCLCIYSNPFRSNASTQDCVIEQGKGTTKQRTPLVVGIFFSVNQKSKMQHTHGKLTWREFHTVRVRGGFDLDEHGSCPRPISDCSSCCCCTTVTVVVVPPVDGCCVRASSSPKHCSASCSWQWCFCPPCSSYQYRRRLAEHTRTRAHSSSAYRTWQETHVSESVEV